MPLCYPGLAPLLAWPCPLFKAKKPQRTSVLWGLSFEVRREGFLALQKEHRPDEEGEEEDIAGRLTEGLIQLRPFGEL